MHWILNWIKCLYYNTTGLLLAVWFVCTLYLCISLLVAQCIAARLVLAYFLCVASINWWNILWLFIEKYCVNKVLFPIRSIYPYVTHQPQKHSDTLPSDHICMGWNFHSMLPFLLCGDWRRNDICLSNAPFYCRFIWVCFW